VRYGSWQRHGTWWSSAAGTTGWSRPPTWPPSGWMWGWCSKDSLSYYVLRWPRRGGPRVGAGLAAHGGGRWAA